MIDVSRTKERFWIWMAWKLPRALVYWASVRLMTAEYGGGPSDRDCSRALSEWKY